MILKYKVKLKTFLTVKLKASLRKIKMSKDTFIKFKT